MDDVIDEVPDAEVPDAEVSPAAASRATRSRTFGVVALLVIVVTAAVVRHPNPLPFRPAPPPVEALVLTGTSGAESDGTGTFWWLDQPEARLQVVNNLDQPRAYDVELVIEGGPCDQAFTVSVGDRSVDVEPFGRATLELADQRLAAYERRSLDLRIEGDPCEPVGADPRALYVRLVSFAVTDAAG